MQPYEENINLKWRKYKLKDLFYYFDSRLAYSGIALTFLEVVHEARTTRNMTLAVALNLRHVWEVSQSLFRVKNYFQNPALDSTSWVKRKGLHLS